MIKSLFLNHYSSTPIENALSSQTSNTQSNPTNNQMA